MNLQKSYSSPSLHRLGEIIGRTGLISSVLFLAFLIGSLTERTAYLPAKWLGNWGHKAITIDKFGIIDWNIPVTVTPRIGSRKWQKYRIFRIQCFFVPISQRALDMIEFRIDSLVERYGQDSIPARYQWMARHPSSHDQLPGNFFKDEIVRNLMMGQRPVKLVADSSLQALNEEVDRYSAEAAIRFGIFFPCCAILAYACTHSQSCLQGVLIAVGGLFLLAIIYLQGISYQTRSINMLALAVGDGLINPPEIDNMIYIAGQKEPDVSSGLTKPRKAKSKPRKNKSAETT